MEHVSHPTTGKGEGSPHFVGNEHGSGLSIILLEAGPGRGPSLHRHDYEEVFVVHEGEVTFTVSPDLYGQELYKSARTTDLAEPTPDRCRW
jgi:quercetin dioxygenase-like cupin family protein